ncbi:MAG: molybdopterin cofactor-binding domain-containing protein [Pseudomonadota bacterium]
MLQAYLSIADDGRVVISTPMSEMGQGIVSSLPKILADELDADWDSVDVALSPGDSIFASPLKGTQATGRSMSVRGYFPLLRSLGAAARDMLTRAAAAEWGVAPAEVVARSGRLCHDASGWSASFGTFARAASQLLPPAEPVLKKRSEFTLIGRNAASKDAGVKTRGTAQYAIDFTTAGMLTAAVRMAPVVGATVAALDDTEARGMPGVHEVVRFGGQQLDLPYPAGVAVVADTFWQAKTAVDALAIEWSGGTPDYSSAADAAARAGRVDEPGIIAEERGDVDTALAEAAARIDVVYEVPYLAHATMEPMTCAARVTADECSLWAPTQGPEVTRKAVSLLLGIPEDAITLNRMFLGGGFGRRYQRDFAVQAAEISRAVDAPVKLVWTREEDIRHDFYRPAQTMRIRAGAAADGRLSALSVTSVGPSLIGWGRTDDRLKGRADVTSFSGINDTHYAIDNFRSRWVNHATPVPIGVWRAVGHSHNGFFLEGAIDEIAVAAGRDPLEFRRDLLRHDPRMRRVLDTAAAKIGWGEAPVSGRGRGIAVMESYGSAIAHAAEVSVADGKLVIHGIEVAVDCGIAVEPRNVEAQLQGGTLFALSALLNGEISFEGGTPQQSNFHDYRMLTLADTPPVGVTILESEHAIGGIGECGVPTTFSSIVNAIYAATGQRIRELPLSRTAL